MAERWRVGRKVGRTLYRQLGPQPSDEDVLIGVMDTPELAERAVSAVNAVCCDLHGGYQCVLGEDGPPVRCCPRCPFGANRPNSEAVRTEVDRG